ncbi:MAG: hypothetical protein ABR575_07485 [Actinomycetota bacterium]
MADNAGFLPIVPSTYYAFKKRPPSQRRLRDEYLKVQIERVWKTNFKVYTALVAGEPVAPARVDVPLNVPTAKASRGLGLATGTLA